MAKLRVYVILLVVLASWTQSGRSFDFSLNDAIDLIRLGRETVMELMESWDMIRSRNPSAAAEGGEQDYMFVRRMEKELRQRIDRVAKKIGDYQERMETKINTVLSQLLIQLPMQRRLDDGMRLLEHYIGQVHGLYDTFELYASDSTSFETYTIIRFAKSCVSPRLGELPDVLKSIHRLLVPSEYQVYNRSILILLANQMQVRHVVCVCLCEGNDAVS
ncbi:hypothetical protein EAI_01991 [Harpegnathos saltator]|uniref:Uncharacterized protein n=1 Tax=Harpegnathos saltator TaxID=610380 RepID=E2B3J1_HARSA|nr:hypothetical protein EAI_01991 [Harpegnathos saltator]